MAGGYFDDGTSTTRCSDAGGGTLISVEDVVQQRPTAGSIQRRAAAP
jgi:hypothetical protein